MDVIHEIESGKSTISISTEGINLTGIHYEYINGYQNKKNENYLIPLKKVLSVEIKRARSKKFLFFSLITGSLLMFLYNLIPRNFNNILSNLTNRMNINIYINCFAVFCAFLLLAYFFSKRKYVEIVYIGGIVRFQFGLFDKMEVDKFIKTFYSIKIILRSINMSIENKFTEYFISPEEKLISVLGNNYLEEFISSGRIESGIAVLSDRRIYLKENVIKEEGKNFINQMKSVLLT